MEIQAPNSAWSGSIHIPCFATKSAHSRSSERELRKVAWNECLWGAKLRSRVSKMGDNSRKIIRILGSNACPRILSSPGVGLKEDVCFLFVLIRFSGDPLNYLGVTGNYLSGMWIELAFQRSGPESLEFTEILFPPLMGAMFLVWLKIMELIPGASYLQM